MCTIGAPSRLATSVKPVRYQSRLKAKTSRLSATRTANVAPAWRRRFSASRPGCRAAG